MCGVGVLAVVPFMKRPLMLQYFDLNQWFLPAQSGEEPLHQ